MKNLDHIKMEVEEKMEGKTLLKDLTEGQKFKVIGIDDCPVITFSHLDGMFSYNTFENGDVVNLRFDTPVEVINND